MLFAGYDAHWETKESITCSIIDWCADLKADDEAYTKRQIVETCHADRLVIDRFPDSRECRKTARTQ